MSTRMFWLPALLTAGLAALGLAMDSLALLRSWLAVSLVWGMIPLGALAVLMTHGLTGGRWGTASRPVWIALAATLPLFVVSMLPLLLGLDELFSWTRPESLLPEVVRKKLLYLNEPFFIGRTFFYLFVWLGLAWALSVWAVPRRVGKSGKGQAVHAPGLILWVLTMTFFGFDWFMSLEPRFYSDVFGLMLCMAAASAALAVGLLLMCIGKNSDVDVEARRDVANLWLAVLLGWAFMAFSQYIIVWSGNLPDEILWYLHRRTSGWRVISAVSFALFFLLPFLILLSGSAKANRRWLITASIACLAGHGLQVLWLILPAFTHWQGTQYWLVPALLVATGSTYAGYGYHRWVAAESHNHDVARGSKTRGEHA
ncbi:MAG TPA: hypothetical protein VIN33_09700 [Marinobacter sp.]